MKVIQRTIVRKQYEEILSDKEGVSNMCDVFEIAQRLERQGN